jgi:hypothetical protein
MTSVLQFLVSLFLLIELSLFYILYLEVMEALADMLWGLVYLMGGLANFNEYLWGIYFAIEFALSDLALEVNFGWLRAEFVLVFRFQHGTDC